MAEKYVFKAKDRLKLKRLFGSNQDAKKDESLFNLKNNRSRGFSFKNNSQDRSKNLAEMCRKRLKFSEFRAINEFLYSNSSKTGFTYLKKENRFEKYHKAYEEIANKWPLKPINWVSEKIIDLYDKSLPNRCIADIGSGKLPLLKINLKLSKVHSFDIVSKHPDIVAANMEHLPLEDSCCDCAVFSLSLMATNLKDIILEANRICKMGGRLIIAEVTSRFEDESLDQFITKLEQFGFSKCSHHYLPPNQYFVGLIAVKRKDVSQLNTKELPNLTLKPCEYKPR